MYSRKNIRPVMPLSGALTERVSPPPDYAGVAFIASDERALQDFPETVIEPLGNDPEPSELIQEETVCLPSEPVPDREDAPEAPADDAEDCSEAGEETSVPPMQSETGETGGKTDITPSASPIEWLKAMKIEDLLLIWMLLMLLYGESRDEIELLLGLLLFTGR